MAPASLAYFTLYLVLALFAGSAAIAIAHIKHRTWLLWAGFCFFLPPLIIILILLPKRLGPAPYEAESLSGDQDDLFREDEWRD